MGREGINLALFEGNLAYGMINDEVAVVQQILIFLGYDTGVVDGCFGAATQEAVIAFQNDHGLYADGIVGAMTKAALGMY